MYQHTSNGGKVVAGDFVVENKHKDVTTLEWLASKVNSGQVNFIIKRAVATKVINCIDPQSGEYKCKHVNIAHGHITLGAVVSPAVTHNNIKGAAEYGKTRRSCTAQSIALTFTKQKSRKLLRQYPAIMTKLPNVAFRSFNFRTGMNQCQNWHLANVQSTDCRPKTSLLLLLFFFYEAGIQNSSWHTKQMLYCLCLFYVLFLFYWVE